MEVYRCYGLSKLLIAGPGRVSFAASTIYTLGQYMHPAQVVHPS